MLRKEIEEKHGKDWWKRKLKINTEHVIKLCVRGIENEKIREALRCGVIYRHPEKAKRYMCVHKEDGDYLSIVFVPANHSNIIISGFPSKPKEIDIFETIRGGPNG